jgi:hypothetical protein
MEKVVASTTFFFEKKFQSPNLSLFPFVFVNKQPNLHGCIFILQ